MTDKGSTGAAESLTLSASVAAFLIGGELLSVGSEGASESYSSGVAFLIAIAFLSAATGAARSVFSRRDRGALLRVSRYIFGILAAATALYVAIATTSEFSRFAAEVMLLRASALPVAVIFLVFCLFLSLKGRRTVRKFAFLTAIAVGIAAAVLMLLSLSSLEPGAVTLGSGAVDRRYTALAFVRKFAPVSVALVYLSLGDGKGDRPRLTPRATAVGLLIGGAILTVCRYNVVLLLGDALSGAVRIPYSAAVSVISTGKLFMRVEGLSYAMYFFSMATRVSVSIGVLIALAREFLPLGNKNKALWRSNDD